MADKGELPFFVPGTGRHCVGRWSKTKVLSRRRGEEGGKGEIHQKKERSVGLKVVGVGMGPMRAMVC